MSSSMSQLQTLLRHLIEANGAIPLDEFMRLAVSHYYANRESIGGSGDFITAPEISQMFGEVLGAWCANEYLQFSQQDFCLVELGAGRGTMMNDILRATKVVPGFASHLRQIVILENSSHLRAKQAAKLEAYANKITWIDSIQDLPKENLIVVANEFLDALPIKQFQKNEGVFYEVGIGLKGGEFYYTCLNPVEIPYPDCREGSVVEICLPAFDIAKNLVERDKYISALFIDYGYFNPSFRSTLQAVKGHKYHDVLADIGEADLTAHVDFGSLAKFFALSGMEVHGSTQGEFLRVNGIELRADKLIATGAKGVETDLNRLISNKQMGELFKVLEVRLKA